MNEATAATYIAYYWGGAMVGRFNGAVSLTDYALSKKLAIMGLISAIAVGTVYFLTNNSSIALTLLGLVAANCIAFMIGKSRPAQTLAIFALAVVVLLLITGFTSGQVALWSVLGIGLFNSIMFPTIFTLAIRDLGKFTGQGSSLLVMAIVGGAVMTPVMGLIVGEIGYQKGMLFAAIPYLYILYYGLTGYQVKKTPL
jgi:MFS transporter, FHS family, L-fucose permease